MIFVTARAMSFGRCVTSKPLCPSTIKSGAYPTGVAMTGVPLAIASSSTRAFASYELGRQNTLASRK
jgi:hypothetical protein